MFSFWAFETHFQWNCLSFFCVCFSVFISLLLSASFCFLFFLSIYFSYVFYLIVLSAPKCNAMNRFYFSLQLLDVLIFFLSLPFSSVYFSLEHTAFHELTKKSANLFASCCYRQFLFSIFFWIIYNIYLLLYQNGFSEALHFIVLRSITLLLVIHADDWSPLFGVDI